MSAFGHVELSFSYPDTQHLLGRWSRSLRLNGFLSRILTTSPSQFIKISLQLPAVIWKSKFFLLVV